MKHHFLIVLSLSLFVMSCTKNSDSGISSVTNPADTTLAIPDTTVDLAVLHYDNTSSLWTLNEQLFSGYAVSLYPDSTLKEKMGILNGRKQNQATRWYPNGQLKQIANYHKGKLHGEKKMWASDTSHVLLSYLNYQSGKPHGEQRKWYPTGELHKKLNLNMGKEEGMQQAFRKNGDVYANYEAKEGRIFGLRKASLCFGLEDENIQSSN